MSIAPPVRVAPRSFRTSIPQFSRKYLPHIKVLADLENGKAHSSIDMQVLADLKCRPLQKHLTIMRVLILEILEILEILLQTILTRRGQAPALR